MADDILATPRPIRQKPRSMSRLEEGFQKSFPTIFIVVIILLVLYLPFSYLIYGYWEWLFVSAVLVFFFGLWFATELPERSEKTLDRLMKCGALRLKKQAEDDIRAQADDSEEDIRKTAEKHLEKNLEKVLEQSAKWRIFGAIGGMIAIIVLAYLAVVNSDQLKMVQDNLGQLFTNPDKDAVRTIGLLLALLCFGFFIGYYFGYAVANGRLVERLQANDIDLVAQPGHPDGVAGFKPIGDLYFFQAMLIALPAAFFVVWWFLIGRVDYLGLYYGPWSSPTLRLFAVVIIVEIIAFILPMWSVHRVMRAQKEGGEEQGGIVTEAAILSHDIVVTREQVFAMHQSIVDIRQEIAEAEDEATVKARTAELTELTAQLAELKDHLSVKTERYAGMQRMPTWPIDTTTFWTFVLANVGAFLPILLQFLAPAASH